MELVEICNTAGFFFQKSTFFSIRRLCPARAVKFRFVRGTVAGERWQMRVVRQGSQRQPRRVVKQEQAQRARFDSLQPCGHARVLACHALGASCHSGQPGAPVMLCYVSRLTGPPPATLNVFSGASESNTEKSSISVQLFHHVQQAGSERRRQEGRQAWQG